MIEEEVLLNLRHVLNPRAKTIHDVSRFIKQVVERPVEYQDILSGLDKTTVDNIVSEIINYINIHNTHSIESFFKDYAYKNKLRVKDVVQPVRVLITGAQISLPLYEIMAVLGKDECIYRLGQYNDQ